MVDTIAALCKCGNYVAVVSKSADQRKIASVYCIAAKPGCQVVEITREDVRQRFGACQCGEQSNQLSLFPTEREMGE